MESYPVDNKNESPISLGKNCVTVHRAVSILGDRRVPGSCHIKWNGIVEQVRNGEGRKEQRISELADVCPC